MVIVIELTKSFSSSHNKLWALGKWGDRALAVGALTHRDQPFYGRNPDL